MVGETSERMSWAWDWNGIQRSSTVSLNMGFIARKLRFAKGNTAKWKAKEEREAIKMVIF